MNLKNIFKTKTINLNVPLIIFLKNLIKTRLFLLKLRNKYCYEIEYLNIKSIGKLKLILKDKLLLI